MSRDTQKKGTVYLVGAGPGHPGLITRLGLELLQKCDAVIYDDLIPYELVAELPANVERYYVGKRAGKHSQPQKDTTNLLISLAERGLNVVRLKGGDPLIFARGGEEATSLKEAGVRFEIVPGVTAVTAVAAGAGIPLTDRRKSAWLMIATGREATSASQPVPWEEIAALKGGTLAVYMGVGALADIVKRLISGGAAPNTPTAVVVSGYTGAQRIITAPLEELPQRCQENDIQPPALVIIGDVVKQMERMDWMTPGVLSGKRILITRPRETSAEFCNILRSHGAEPLPLPTIQIEPYEDIEGWDVFAQSLGRPGWLVFTSRSGVQHFLDGFTRRGYDLRALSNLKIAAIGPATARILWERGLKADLIPGEATVARLAEESAAADDLLGTVVIRIRGDLSDDTIENAVSSKEARVVRLTVYRTVTPEWEPHWLQVVREDPPDYITFTSGSTVDGFVKILGRKDALSVAARSKVVSIGPVTTKVIEGYGMKVAAEAAPHTQEGVVKAILILGRSDTSV